uniref:Putative WW-binding domain-containing protein n=1 Tax=Myripristis murdjan TaxID=586833 RepID=A0A667XAH5_9TELE
MSFFYCPLKADGDSINVDSTFNSFQYWRVPLPELDLSLLEDTSNQPEKSLITCDQKLNQEKNPATFHYMC